MASILKGQTKKIELHRVAARDVDSTSRLSVSYAGNTWCGIAGRRPGFPHNVILAVNCLNGILRQ